MNPRSSYMVELFPSVSACNFDFSVISRSTKINIYASENFRIGMKFSLYFITYLTMKITIMRTISKMKVTASGTMTSKSRLVSSSSLALKNNNGVLIDERKDDDYSVTRVHSMEKHDIKDRSFLCAL